MRSIVKAENAATGGLEIKEARLDIGPKCDSGAHVFSKAVRGSEGWLSLLATLILVRGRLACHIDPGLDAAPI